jgi:hypothetical protein
VSKNPRKPANLLSLVGSSRVDASSLPAARDVLLKALIDVDLADFTNESSSHAVAFVVSEQIGARSIVLARNRFALVDVDLAIASSVARWTFANGSRDIGETDSAVFAGFNDAVSVVAESSLVAFAAETGEVVAGRQVCKTKTKTLKHGNL